MFGGIRAGQHVAVHVFGTERIHAHACDQARIDSARKAKNNAVAPNALYEFLQARNAGRVLLFSVHSTHFLSRF